MNFDSLTHWGKGTRNLTITSSDNGLSPGRHQAIIWTNAGILTIGPSGTNLSEILIEIQTFSFRKMHPKISSAKWRPFCFGLNVLDMDWYWHGAAPWSFREDQGPHLLTSTKLLNTEI